MRRAQQHVLRHALAKTRAYRRNMSSNAVAITATAAGIAAGVVALSSSEEAWQETSSDSFRFVPSTRSLASPSEQQDVWLKRQPQIQREYVLGNVIGEGGFGQVHLGVHRESKAPVAIKRVPKEFTSKEKFLQEVRILSIVGGHQNIVALRDAFETADSYVLVTDLVHGSELYESLVTDGIFSEDEAKVLIQELVLSLQFLHSKRVVHADIKPENILLNNGDDSSLMRLIDFGLAFRENLENERTRSSRSGVATTAYAAPEFLTEESPSRAIDIWALGVVLYIVLCGRHPFDPNNDASDEELKKQILSGDFDKTNELWQSISPEAKDLISQMLRMNPARRISTDKVLGHKWFSKDVQETEALARRCSR